MSGYERIIYLIILTVLLILFPCKFFIYLDKYDEYINISHDTFKIVHSIARYCYESSKT